jgi:hypothetical protein
MILALGALGLLLLAVPAMSGGAARRIPASEWTRVTMAALSVGAVTVFGAVVLAAVPAIASTIDAPAVLDPCRGVFAPLAADPTLLSWLAAGIAAMLVIRFLRGAARSLATARRARIEPWLGEHQDEQGFELVVLPTYELVAFGVPGRPPQVVISKGLVDELDPAETAAVIEHEAAHHRLHHSRYLMALAAIERAFGWYPPARRSVEAARSAIEAWADDQTSVDDEDARRSLRRALAGMRRSTPQTDARLHRLTRIPRFSHPMVRFASYVPVALIMLTAAMIVTGWLTDAHHAVALGDPCRH